MNKNSIQFIERINNKECIVQNYKPKISEMTKHAIENLNNKSDRADMSIEKAQYFVNNAKIVLYDINRFTIKFISESGY